jgi:hypothetical protein
MSGCPPFDFPKANQVTPFEVAIAVFEFPKRRVGGACMKDIAYFVKPVHVQLPYERRYIRMFEVLRQNFGKFGGRRHDEAFI